MKTITKTIGCIGVSVALWHTPHGCAITLDQINAYLTDCRNKSIRNLEALLEQEEKRSDSDIKAANTEYIRKFLENYRKKKGVYYDGNGDFVLETVNLNNSPFELLAPFSTYQKQKSDDWKQNQKVNPLDAISETLSADTLKQRGADIAEMKQYGIKNVREITFESILKSPFFSKEQREEGAKWFKDSDALKVAVQKYAEHCAPLRRQQANIKISLKNTYIYTNNKGHIQTLTEPDKTVLISDCLFAQISESEAVALRQKIQSDFERMLSQKNGKEKVILFLLLDKKTPPETRCKWVWDGRKGKSSAFEEANNAFLCNPDDIEGAISHEIGHYLQVHLDLEQTFEDYQSPFAKKLLLLENDRPSNTTFELPRFIRDAVCPFNPSMIAKDAVKLSTKACFEYCQLVARWTHPDEISNILGVYFRGDTLYVHALSDIRELKRIRYGHNAKIGTEAIAKSCTLLKDENTKQAFTSICNEAFGRTVPTEALRLLCKLHGRASEDAENVVCDFDYDGQECAEKVEPALMDFIEAGQP